MRVPELIGGTGSLVTVILMIFGIMCPYYSGRQCFWDLTVIPDSLRTSKVEVLFPPSEIEFKLKVAVTKC